MSQSFIISPKIGKKFELPPPKTLTHPVSPHVLFPQKCLTTAPKMARFQLALRHRGLFFHVAPLHYLSPNEKRAPWLFWGCKGMKHYTHLFCTAGYIWCYIRNIARVYNWLFRGFVRDTSELRHLLSTWKSRFLFRFAPPQDFGKLLPPQKQKTTLHFE